MKKFFAILILLSLGITAFAMINSYHFKLKGKIISISPIISGAAVTSSCTMEIKVLSVMPAAKGEPAVGGERFKGREIFINGATARGNVELNKLKRGDIIVGDFFSIEVEQHPCRGYRTTNTLAIEKRIGKFF